MTCCTSVEALQVYLHVVLFNSAWKPLTPSPMNATQWDNWFTASEIQAIVFTLHFWWTRHILQCLKSYSNVHYKAEHMHSPYNTNANPKCFYSSCALGNICYS